MVDWIWRGDLAIPRPLFIHEWRGFIPLFFSNTVSRNSLIQKSVVVHSNGRECVGRWGDGEMGGWGVREKLKKIYLHHYHAGLPKSHIKSG
ncbi:MAG: hypothetical protein F6K24_46305 [Okeania sp. SIO2D1]|nr:hypothetical protein [Okeania sp. SIO2D1]